MGRGKQNCSKLHDVIYGRPLICSLVFFKTFYRSRRNVWGEQRRSGNRSELQKEEQEDPEEEGGRQKEREKGLSGKEWGQTRRSGSIGNQ